MVTMPDENPHYPSPGRLSLSVTDARGVISRVNDDLVAALGLGVDEVVGHPHNVLRHPQAPSGLFRLMWDNLRAGDPFACHLLNRTASGTTWPTTLVVVPSGQGYLGVSFSSGLGDALDLSRSLQDSALEVELSRAGSGAAPAAVAVFGANELQRGAAEHGARDFAALGRAALRTEVRQQLADLGQVYPDVSQEGDATARLLQRCSTLRQQCAELVERAEELTQLVTLLSDETAQLRELVERDDECPPDSALNSLAVRVWAQMRPGLHDGLLPVLAQSDAFAMQVELAHQWASIAWVHARCLEQMVAAPSSNPTIARGELDALHDLATVLHHDLSTLSQHALAIQTLSPDLAERLTAARDLVAGPRTVMARLENTDELLASMVNDLDEEFRGLESTAGLARLAQRSTGLAAAAPLLDEVSSLTRTVVALGPEVHARRGTAVPDDAEVGPRRSE